MSKKLENYLLSTPTELEQANGRIKVLEKENAELKAKIKKALQKTNAILKENCNPKCEWYEICAYLNADLPVLKSILEGKENGMQGTAKADQRGTILSAEGGAQTPVPPNQDGKNIPICEFCHNPMRFGKYSKEYYCTCVNVIEVGKDGVKVNGAKL